MPTSPEPRGGAIDSNVDQFQYDETPTGWQKLWDVEMDAADKEVGPWHKQASEVLSRYLSTRREDDFGTSKRLNLFPSNTVTVEAMLYGKPPQTDVTRKFNDANDEIGRVAALMMQRILNGDIQRPDDKFAKAVGHALADFLRVDFGDVKLRYANEMRQVKGTAAVKRRGMVVVPAVPDHEEKAWEDVETDYYNWRDVRWSPCKVPEEMRWRAWRTPMTRTQLVERFGHKGLKVPLSAKGYDRDNYEDGDDQPKFPWDRADVWEIWSKEHGKVFWYVKGAKKILDVQKDPLELRDFWPSPTPMHSWATTSRFLPRCEYKMAEDSYLAIEKLTTRIDLLTDSLRVVGVFDENFKELQNMLEETDENTMIPVANWAMFAQKGGIDGAVSWFPVEQVVKVLEQLREQRVQEIELNRQITGMADIHRGDTDPNETLGAQKMKSHFAAVRIQRKQDIFAEFVSAAQRIRAEIIAKRFDDDEIRARSNIDATDDAEYADEAIKLLREDVDGLRVIVKPEAVSMTDFDAMKMERTEFVTAVGGFFGMMSKLPPQAMSIAPELAEVLRWYAAGFRGATTIENAMDRLVSKLEKMADQPQGQQGPDPKIEAEKIKAQAQQQKTQMEMQAEREKIQLEAQARSQEIQEETQAEIEKQKAQFEYNAREKQIEHQHEMEETAVEAQHHRQVEHEKMEHDAQVEKMKAEHGFAADAMQAQVSAQADERKLQHGLVAEKVKTEHGMAAQEHKHGLGLEAQEQKHGLGLKAQDQKAKHAERAQKTKSKDAIAQLRAKSKTVKSVGKPKKGK